MVLSSAKKKNPGSNSKWGRDEDCGSGRAAFSRDKKFEKQT